MIIVCSGPDTYNARRKARELVEAFRRKHDPSGLATDIVFEDLRAEDFFSRIGTPSLFATKRMVRADGCLRRMKAAEVKTFSEKLIQLGDQIVFLTVEEDPPTAKILDLFAKVPVHHFPFAFMASEKFRSWVREQAHAVGVSDELADLIAEMNDGDAWAAMSELFKAASGGSILKMNKSNASGNIFDLAERAILLKKGWRADLAHEGDGGFLSIFLGQLRAYIRVKDKAADGIHPFVQKKMIRLHPSDVEKRFGASLAAHAAARFGIATDEESQALF